MAVDRRRRQYFPLSVYFAQGKTGVRLLERFGRDGLLVWVLYLTACKTNWVQGQLTYASEADGWMKLQLTGHEPDFTLDEFFGFTGQLKQTRTTRSGHVKDVVCTQWIRWNYDVKTQLEAERKSRKRAGNTPDNTPDIPAPEVEVEVELEEEVEAGADSAAANAAAATLPRPPFNAPTEPPHTQLVAAVRRFVHGWKGGGSDVFDEALDELEHLYRARLEAGERYRFWDQALEQERRHQAQLH